MKRILFTVLAGLLLSLSTTAAEDTGESKPINLFNGKDLDGWEGHKELWSVIGGVIVAKNTEPFKDSGYLLTKEKHRNFHLTEAVKLLQLEVLSSIAFWGRVAPETSDAFTYASHLVMFSSGWGMSDLYGHNGLPVDGRPGKKVGRLHDQNDREILCQGGRVCVAVSGKLVLDWRDPVSNRMKKGPTGLQLHSDTEPQKVNFKDLILTTSPEDKMTAVK